MNAPTGRRSLVARALLAAIGFYSRAISPAFPPRCRFYPTCSAYAAQAVQTHGALRGTGLALVRLLKCAPWHPGGIDLVPGTSDGGHSSRTAAPSPVAAATRPTPGAATRPTDRAPAQDHRRANEENSVA